MIRVLKSKRMNIKTGKIGLYYKGGFESPMSKREAYLILGVSRTASASEIKERHKKMMMLNHPDSGININKLKYTHII
jgi:DnaJ-domain-containing protein 1